MKLDFNHGVVQFNENGEFETDIVTSLPHRLTVVDGEVVDKYPGKTDREVRIADHAEAAKLVAADQAEWDELSEDIKSKTVRPADLPELDLPEEE
jgi:hypothetical protein